MLYLEDYLEIIENLPQELCDRFTAIRELDLQVHNEMDILEVRANSFFSNAPTMSTEMRDSQFDKIKQDYYKTLEEAEEKVSLANQLYELVDKYLRRLEHEVLKFKIELEADNAGITEILEKRSLDLDSPKTSSNHIREKRKLVFSTETINQKSNPVPIDKMLHDISQGSLNAGGNNLVTSKQIINTPLSSTNSFDKPGCFSFFNPKLNADKKSINPKFNITGNNAIAAAASQAIAATQQMQLGRRSASLKASFEAINSNNINSIRLDDSLDSSVSNPFLKMSNGLEDSEKSLKRVRMNKRSRTTQFNIDLSNNNSNATSSDTMNTEWSSADPGEQRYCTCNNISYGEMIYCENNQCPFQWFHLDCVGIKVPPAGSWFCPRCSADKKERKKKE